MCVCMQIDCLTTASTPSKVSLYLILFLIFVPTVTRSLNATATSESMAGYSTGAPSLLLVDVDWFGEMRSREGRTDFSKVKDWARSAWVLRPVMRMAVEVGKLYTLSADRRNGMDIEATISDLR